MRSIGRVTYIAARHDKAPPINALFFSNYRYPPTCAWWPRENKHTIPNNQIKRTGESKKKFLPALLLASNSVWARRGNCRPFLNYLTFDKIVSRLSRVFTRGIGINFFRGRIHGSSKCVPSAKLRSHFNDHDSAWILKAHGILTLSIIYYFVI